MASRLRSILEQLPMAALPPRLLNVGCGEWEEAATLRQMLPGWTFYGIDLDSAALRRALQSDPRLRLVQGDAIHIPGLLRASFGLILVRHPDLFRRTAWRRILPALPHQLAPGGYLLITLYAPEEAEHIRAVPLPPLTPLDGRALAAPDLAGHDRFPLLYGAAIFKA